MFYIGKIVSTGQATLDGKWYDQEQDEWVILLEGKAGLLLENKSEPLVLCPGDHIHIPAHLCHRVEWTDSPTVWLALHFSTSEDEAKDLFYSILQFFLLDLSHIW